MDHIKALITKFVMCTAVLFVVLSLFYGVDFGDVLLISVVLTIVSYLGDVYVLPNTSNAVATSADLGLAFVIIWLIGGGIIEENIPIVIASIISAAVIAVGEIFFHMYMKRNVLDDEPGANPGVSTQSFSTEFASDEKDIEEEYENSSNKDEHRN